MSAIITSKFRINNAEQFLESFTEASPNVYYLGIGKPQAHATQTRPDARTENMGSDTHQLCLLIMLLMSFTFMMMLLLLKK